jgi:hypothetical protein
MMVNDTAQKKPLAIRSHSIRLSDKLYRILVKPETLHEQPTHYNLNCNGFFSELLL